MSTLKTTILLSALACLTMSSAAFAQDNVPVKAPESLKNVPFKIEGVDGFLQSLGIDPKTEIKLSKKELRSLAESNYNDIIVARLGTTAFSFNFFTLTV